MIIGNTDSGRKTTNNSHRKEKKISQITSHRSSFACIERLRIGCVHTQEDLCFTVHAPYHMTNEGSRTLFRTSQESGGNKSMKRQQ